MDTNNRIEMDECNLYLRMVNPSPSHLALQMSDQGSTLSGHQSKVQTGHEGLKGIKAVPSGAL